MNNEQINNRIEGIKSTAANEIEAIQRRAQLESSLWQSAGPYLIDIEKALQKIGLTIGDVSGHVTEYHKPEDKDQLILNIYAEPISGKFKFIKDQGYTSRGNAVNEKRLKAEAEKIETILNDACLELRFSVNQYSLQVKESSESRRVLIETRIKQ